MLQLWFTHFSSTQTKGAYDVCILGKVRIKPSLKNCPDNRAFRHQSITFEQATDKVNFLTEFVLTPKLKSTNVCVFNAFK